MNRSNLDSTLKSLQESDDNITTLDDGWSQGRSAFGGISAAFAMTAMRKLVPYDLPLRSLSVSFIAPVPPGKVLVETEIDRSALGKDLKLREFQIIIETLRQENGKKKIAAEKLGISPRTLRYKLAQMREVGIDLAAELAA